MSALKRNLAIIWDETTNGGADGRRYIAKSLDGGTGWGVFDRRKGRFLKDREVAALEDVREQEHTDMTDEQALAHQIIKQALHDPANVMMLGEVKPLADAYVAQEARARKLVEALSRAIGDIQWMSGASDFGPDGKAHDGWLKVRGALKEYAAALAEGRGK